jgi:hypothetical protein
MIDILDHIFRRVGIISIETCYRLSVSKAA